MKNIFSWLRHRLHRVPCVIPITLVSWYAGVYVIVLITGAIGIVVILWPWLSWKKKLFFLVILFEIVCVIKGTLFSVSDVDTRTWVYDNLSRGIWVYGGVQTLVWMKWAGGSYILSKKNSSEFFGISPHGWGNLVYSSAFLRVVYFIIPNTTYTVTVAHGFVSLSVSKVIFNF